MAKPWSIWNIAVTIFAVIGVLAVVAMIGMIGMWVMHGGMMGRMGGSPSGQPLVSCGNAEMQNSVALHSRK